MKSSKIGLIGLSVAVAIGAANFAHAEDILLAHDRGLYIDTFNEIGSQVGVTVEHASYGDVNQYKAYIQNSILTGDEPDIFVWWGGRAFEDIVDTGIASNVDSYWDNMIEIGRFPASIRSPYTVNGESFGLPFGVAHWMTWYHKDKFAEAGIDTAPTTWAELEAVADKLIAAGITPFNASIEGGWRGFIWFEEIFIRTNPEAFAGLFTGETAYDSEPVREVFKSGPICTRVAGSPILVRNRNKLIGLAVTRLCTFGQKMDRQFS